MRTHAGNDEAETRVDYLADILGIEKATVIDAVGLMREAGLLDDMMDMSAYIYHSDTQSRSAQALNRFLQLERFLLSQLNEEQSVFNLKELNESAMDAGLSFSTVQRIRTVLYYWYIKGYIQKGEFGADQRVELVPAMSIGNLKEKFERRIDICNFVLNELFSKGNVRNNRTSEDVPVEFSLLGLCCSTMLQQTRTKRNANYMWASQGLKMLCTFILTEIYSVVTYRQV